MRRGSLMLAVGLVTMAALTAPTSEAEQKVRNGLFGISGIIPDTSYLDELCVDCAVSGFWIGPSEGFLGGSKEALHNRQMRQFVELGITPIATFYLGNVTSETARYVESIVEHYTSGSGVDEVGIPVCYWEVGDEENAAWGTSCDPEEYARRVSIVASGIRRACPGCVVVMGGLLDGPEMGDWALSPYLRRFLAAGGGEWIDVYAFHYFGLARPSGHLPHAQLYHSAEAIVGAIRSALANYELGDRPIWVTETSTFSGGMGAIEQSESDQAADLVKRYVLLWALGVEKVLWTYLTEPQYEGTGVGFFDQTGLVYDGIGPYDRGAGVKKTGYLAYVHLIARLRGATLVEWDRRAGVFIARFSSPEGDVTVLWQDPWIRTGPIWVEPTGEVVVENIVGETIAVQSDRFRLDLDLEPVYILGNVAAVSLNASLLQAPGG
jgi:hypothetical protein